MSNEMKVAMQQFKCAMEKAQQRDTAEQKWEAWKKVTWQSRRFAMKQANLKHRMRCL